MAKHTSNRVSFDHTSIAVPDPSQTAAILRRDLGATPICGELLPQFRYVLFHVGDVQQWSRIELIGPGTQPGFIERFLQRHGAGPHHLTFIVDDIRAHLDRVAALGLRVTVAEVDHAAWREAFILPDKFHGTLIQLAQTDRRYPSPETLLATKHRDPDGMPSNRGATDRYWWASVWDTTPRRRSMLRSTELATTDLDVSQRLFGDILGGVATPADGDTVEFAWDSGILAVRRDSSPGITRLQFADATVLPGRLHTRLL